jgi:gliding motility-associated-like protein
MVKRSFTLIYFFFFIGLSLLNAKHIVGGDITYVCKGNGVYEFTMKIYRDPFGAGATFDNPAQLAVYRCGTNINCGSVSKFQAFITTQIFLTSEQTITNPTYPCLTTPPNIRVDEGIYRFTLTLPPSDESYHIVYQRCCRNNTINNIYNPEDTGATFSMEITPYAQTVCNDSPVYASFPPTVICSAEPFEYLHNAIDPDNDQIVYEFCAPLNGGGPDQGPNPTSCEGIVPTPPCPPPFDAVSYILPTYSPLQPMAGDPVISIDPATGLIYGTPTVTGQFVVGVCASEYRNGQLLSVLRRDFQFNVTPCESNVVASVFSDSVIGPKSYLINSCGNNELTFIDQSYQPQNIFSWNWAFDMGNNIATSTQQNPTFIFPDIGTYSGWLVVNAGTICEDSAEITVNIYPEIIADFEFDYDTCIAGPVIFNDISTTTASTITQWDWNFNGVGSSVNQNPFFQFNTPGEKAITLHITDENNCEDQITKNITWLPVPQLIIVEPSSFTLCLPATITFNNLSSPIDPTYTIFWDFGDGNTGGDISPTHTYTEPGIYNVFVSITSPIGCSTEATFPSWIKIDPSPIAAFEFSPTEIFNTNAFVQFTDKSQLADRWNWQFDALGSSTLQNPSFIFQDTGLQTIILTVTHPSGCQDTAIAFLDIIPRANYIMPNAFTPNNDGSNDRFLGKGYFEGMRNFEMIIFNRWGEAIFETNDPQSGWDGTYRNTNNQAPPGVYAYKVSYDDSRGNSFSLQGFAVLVE